MELQLPISYFLGCWFRQKCYRESDHVRVLVLNQIVTIGVDDQTISDLTIGRPAERTEKKEKKRRGIGLPSSVYDFPRITKGCLQGQFQAPSLHSYPQLPAIGYYERVDPINSLFPTALLLHGNPRKSKY